MCVRVWVPTHREDDKREAGEEKKERGPVFGASGLEVQLRSQRGQHGEQETDGENTQRSAERGVVDGQCSRLFGGNIQRRGEGEARITSRTHCFALLRTQDAPAPDSPRP